jgi:type IX secretion system PorP/SprF family membrane protein
LVRAEWFQKDREGFNILAGGYVVQDATGPTGFTGAYLRAGGIFTDDPEQHGIVAALTFGMVQYRVNTFDLQLREKDDILIGESRQQTYPDVGLGVFAYQKLNGNFSDDIIYAGVSMPQALGLSLDFKNGNGTFSTQRVRHYYAQAGWYHFLGEGTFLEPSVWLKYVPNTPFNADINLRFQLSNSFWVGAGASNRGKIHAEAGAIVGEALGLNGRLRIGYGFDYSFASFGALVGAAHEFNVNVSF